MVKLCFGEILQKIGSIQDAKDRAFSLAEKKLKEDYLPRVNNTDHPPKTYLSLSGNTIITLIGI